MWFQVVTNTNKLCPLSHQHYIDTYPNCSQIWFGHSQACAGTAGCVLIAVPHELWVAFDVPNHDTTDAQPEPLSCLCLSPRYRISSPMSWFSRRSWLKQTKTKLFFYGINDRMLSGVWNIACAQLSCRITSPKSIECERSEQKLSPNLF